MGDDSVRQLVGMLVGVGTVLLLLVLLHFRKQRTNQKSKRLPPGPKPWPIVGSLGELEKMSHQGFANISKQYNSPLIHLWLGSVHLIVANSMDTAREILKVHDQNFASRPRMTQFVELNYDLHTISTAPHGRMWRHLRKVLVLELLTARRIQQFQPVRLEEIKTAVKTLMQESNGEKPVTIVFRVKEHLTNIITRMMMSKRYFGPKAVGSTDSVEFQARLKSLLELLSVFHVGDYIPFFKYWDIQGNKKRMRSAHGKFDDFLQKVIDERREQLAPKRHTGDSELQEKGDFLDVLLTRSVNADDVEVTDNMIKGILQDSIVGGVDSPANTVEWALAELMRHPKVLKKAQDELDTVVGRDRLVAEEDIPKLLYIQAIVKEIFRLHPVTPLLVPHQAQEACEIAGYYVPKGSQVYVNVWAIGRDPKVWENPLDYNPERFLGSPIDVHGFDFELLPFGTGRRKCPGISMGLLEVHYMLAVLIQSCNWSFPPGHNPNDLDMTEGIGIVNHRANPLQAIVTPRLAMETWA